MTIPNHITLDDLRTMQIGEIVALPAEQLALLQDAANEALRSAKSVSDWLEGAIALKYTDRAVMARMEASKDTGTVRFDDDAVTVIADLPKRVDWGPGCSCRSGGAHQRRWRRSCRICRCQLQGTRTQIRRLARVDPPEL